MKYCSFTNRCNELRKWEYNGKKYVITIVLATALPDVWKGTVEIKGLRARGGFEIISLKWKNGQIESAVIKSTLGGNLHLRVHQELAMDGKSLSVTDNGNANPFFAKQPISRPLISEKAPLKGIELKKSYVYEIATQAGETYTFTNVR